MVTPDNSSIGSPIKKVYYSEDDHKKFAPPPKASKDFKKYLDNDHHRPQGKVSKGPDKPDKDDEESSAASVLETSSEGEQSVMSLLASKSAAKMKKPLTDTSKTKADVKSDDKVAVNDSEIPKKSPLDVFQTKQNVTRDWALDDTVDPFEGETKSPEKEHEEDKYLSEHGDLTSVNPFALGSLYNATTVHATTDSVASVDHSAMIATMRELADKVLDGIVEMKQNGDTSTIVTIKNMPLFNDARIVLTTSANAANEFNVAFENLRPDAKQLIDQNLNTLRLVLDDSSYVNAVHILTTSTLIEHPLPTDTDRNFARGDREDQEEQKRQQKEKDKG